MRPFARSTDSACRRRWTRSHGRGAGSDARLRAKPPRASLRPDRPLPARRGGRFSVKYECQFDLSNKNMSQTLTVDLVGGNKDVLEFGCAAGAVSNAMRERACTVVGIEFDRDLASAAKEF